MTKSSAHLERYRNRLAKEEVAASLGPYPWMGLIIACVLLWRALFTLTGWPALLSAGIAGWFLAIWWGLRRAADWARVTIGSAAALGVVVNLWTWWAQAAELRGLDHVQRGIGMAIGLSLAFYFLGREGREQFARARLFDTERGRPPGGATGGDPSA
ncbi:hypothetical protein Poly30_38190 [Planctomycetes bacterium Poly30]|uniref:Uncharacterized protein n=1 Tax=Saltatorellus ferox TaxID=2528018 RepID=A0A518EW16_9BACT|nr:hypothetical protein Poly30_38190 [Planctomycetes bacterium Poly30]